MLILARRLSWLSTTYQGGLLDSVRAHLPERGLSFVWAPDPGPGRRSGRWRKKTPGTNRADR
jgi:hypothetical protein